MNRVLSKHIAKMPRGRVTILKDNNKSLTFKVDSATEEAYAACMHLDRNTGPNTQPNCHGGSYGNYINVVLADPRTTLKDIRTVLDEIIPGRYRQVESHNPRGGKRNTAAARHIPRTVQRYGSIDRPRSPLTSRPERFFSDEAKQYDTHLGRLMRRSRAPKNINQRYGL
jgi:hypothetical protein